MPSRLSRRECGIEIYELEAEKVFALLERAKHTEPLKEAFDECETHLEELEDWLSVFSGKLSTMRRRYQHHRGTEL